MSDSNSLKPKGTKAQMDNAIRRAVTALKNNHDDVNPSSVSRRAASYPSCNVPKRAIEIYLNSLVPAQRIAEYGFPDPNAKKEPIKVRTISSVAQRRNTWGDRG